jgi:hypothetical protein
MELGLIRNISLWRKVGVCECVFVFLHSPSQEGIDDGKDLCVEGISVKNPLYDAERCIEVRYGTVQLELGLWLGLGLGFVFVFVFGLGIGFEFELGLGLGLG